MLRYLLFLTLVATNDVDKISTQSLRAVLDESRSRNDVLTLCGPLSLARAMRIDGINDPFEEVVGKFQSRTANGVRAEEIIDVGEFFGWHCQGINQADRDLSKLPLPAILIVNESQHCITLEALPDEASATIWDPVSFRVERISRVRLSKIWQGNAIVPCVSEIGIHDIIVVGVVMLLALLACLTVKTPWNRDRPSAEPARLG